MPTTSEAQQQAASRAVIAAAAAEVTAGLLTVQVDDLAALADWIVDFLPGIAEEYGMAMAVLGASWYETLRDEAGVSGTFDPVLPELPDPYRWESMARWVTAGNKAEVETLVQGGVQRTLMNMHRETVMDSVVADPEAAGWARFARPGACGFCRMLTSRGAVFTEKTAKFGAHDHCSCLAGPIWKGRGTARQVDAYRKSARRREDADGNAIGSTKRDAERARRWMKENGLA